MGMAILGILMNSKNQIYIIFFPIFIITISKFPESYLGFFITIPIFFHIFQFYFGKLADSISAEFGVLLGVFLSSSAIFLFPYISEISMLISLLIIFGIGSSIWNVNAWTLMANIAKKENIEGEIVGTYISIAKLGVFFSTLISANLISMFGISRTLQLFAILILIGNIIVYFLFQPIFHHENKRSHFYKILNN